MSASDPAPAALRQIVHTATPYPRSFDALFGVAGEGVTRKVLGLDAALIGGFHTVRIITVMAPVVPLFKLFDRLMDRFGVA